MKTFQLTLSGYNPESSETDHLIKWVNADSTEPVSQFVEAAGWKLAEPMEELEELHPTREDGVDHILDEAGLKYELARLSQAIPGKNVGQLVMDVIAENLALEVAEMERIAPDTKIMHDLGADSLDCVEIVIHLEEEIGFDMTDGGSDDFHINDSTTISDLFMKVAETIRDNIDGESGK